MADYFPIYSYLGKRYDLNGMSGGASENTLYLLYAILFIVVIFVFYKINDRYDSLLYNLRKQQKMERRHTEQEQIYQEQIQSPQNVPAVTKKINLNINQNQDQIPPVLSPPTMHPPANPVNIWREYDYRALNDPLVAPRRRDDYNLPVLPLPTRGFPAPYKKVGLLIDRSAHDNDKYKILLLMGRNTFPSSTAYDYYAVENDKNSSLKFDINRTREMQSGDKVKIEELEKVYTVVMDKILGYEYDPYLY